MAKYTSPKTSLSLHIGAAKRSRMPYHIKITEVISAWFRIELHLPALLLGRIHRTLADHNETVGLCSSSLRPQVRRKR